MTMDRDERDKDREKDRDRDRARERDRDREREKVKLKERDRDSQKKDRVKEAGKGRTQEKEKDRDRIKSKEREKDKGKDQEREKERAKHQEREKDKVKAEERAKERDRKERDQGKEKERPKTDREKDREKERDRARQREKVGEREKDRENGREKERVHEDREERERDKERGREKEMDHQKSRWKEKERDREKERDYDRERNKDREEREKERDRGKDDLEKDRKRDDKVSSSKEADGSRLHSSVLEARIAKMRDERLKATAEHKGSAKKSDTEDDIQSWVNKSRKIEQRKQLDDKQKAARMAKILADQDNENEDEDSDEFESTGYGGKDLGGLKINHGLDKVMEGHAIVLTLKDVNVLDGDDVNSVPDELENIEIAQQRAREDSYKAAKKKPGTYEDKFNNDISGIGTRAILPQYDEILNEEGVVLDADGGLNEETRKRFEEVRQKLEGAKESLSAATKLTSDYFTEEDMLQFKKPKKKKKLRKKNKLDIDELEAEAIASGLGAGDHGARDSEARRSQKQAEEKAEADARRNAYQTALNRAEDVSRVFREENTAKPMEVDKMDSFVIGGEDDEDLNKSIERARQAALKKQRESGGAGAGGQAVVARLANLKNQTERSGQTHPGADTQEGSIVFTDTGEFCRSLQLDDAIVRRAGAKDVFGEEDEEGAVEETEKEESNVAGGWTEVVEASKKQPVREEEADEGEQPEEPILDVSVGKGLAGALNLLKERGTLKETVDWGGRNMDKKRSKLVGIVDESNNKVGQRDILLDRVDEFGRTMTPKEAFRKLSHKFHGKGPGKMKQEKKMKQFQEELRLKQMNSGDTPLMSMEKMRDAQARMHTPYIVISGHIKPGQTSDPRSGFATVEKEPIGSLTPMLGDKGVGSLTPMLGDKKVEHYLGIKRKAEVGTMGPPLAKQPKLER